MNATAQKQAFQRPARPNKTVYLASDVAHALADDAAFFADNPGVHHRIRKATASETKAILDRRPLEPTDSCDFVALIRLEADGVRRRVLLQAYAVDIEAMSEAEIASLFDNVVTSGWTWIGDLP